MMFRFRWLGYMQSCLFAIRICVRCWFISWLCTIVYLDGLCIVVLFSIVVLQGWCVLCVSVGLLCILWLRVDFACYLYRCCAFILLIIVMRVSFIIFVLWVLLSVRFLFMYRCGNLCSAVLSFIISWGCRVLIV